MRVHELAKEYDIKATEFVDIIQGFGINISSHLSGLDDAQISDIRHKMSIQNEIKDPEVNQWASSPLPPEEVAELTVEEGHSCHHTEEDSGFTAEDKAEVQSKLAEVKERQFASIDKPKGFFGWLASLFS